MKNLFTILILLCCGAAWAQPHRNNFATTNQNDVLTNIVKSVATNVVTQNASGGSQTPWTSDIAAAFHNLTSAATLVSSNSIATNSANVGSNGVSPSGIALNVEGAERVNGTLSVSNSAVIQGASLVLPTGSINVPAGSVTANTFSGNGASVTGIPTSSLTTGPLPIITHGLTVSGAGGVYGVTNLDLSFCITNQINHSFDLWTTNGDYFSSNAVAGTYTCRTNGVWFFSTNVIIGGTVIVSAGSSMTVSNLINLGTNVFMGTTLASNSIFIDAAHSLSLSNATAGRIAMIGAAHDTTNATASGAVPINADGTATTAAQIATIVSPTNYVGFAVHTGEAAMTNSITTTIALGVDGSLVTTNASWTILGITGKDTTGKTVQWASGTWTNSAGLGSAFQTNLNAAANIHVIGPTSSSITNWTDWLLTYQPPNGPTNLYIFPDW